MAFNFKDLSVTLTTSDDNVPEARLIVKTCPGMSLEMLYATCGTDTQECDTNPENMKLLLTKGNPGDLKELQLQLEEMLKKFGPDGTKTVAKTLTKQKVASPARSASSGGKGTKRRPKP